MRKQWWGDHTSYWSCLMVLINLQLWNKHLLRIHFCFSLFLRHFLQATLWHVKGMTYPSCHTETENTDIISAPNKLGHSAELLSESLKTRVGSGLLLWCLFCSGAVRNPVSCMISAVVILIRVRSHSGPVCSTIQEIQQIDYPVSHVILSCETWMLSVVQQDILPRRSQNS